MQKRIPLALATAAALWCASQAQAETWRVSYYPHPEGRAAHRWLPRGTPVRVTNHRNGKSVLVIIDDRGPYVRKDPRRKLDLAYRDAKTLGFLKQGVAELEIEILDK